MIAGHMLERVDDDVAVWVPPRVSSPHNTPDWNAADSDVPPSILTALPPPPPSQRFPHCSFLLDDSDAEWIHGPLVAALLDAAALHRRPSVANGCLAYPQRDVSEILFGFVTTPPDVDPPTARRRARLWANVLCRLAPHSLDAPAFESRAARCAPADESAFVHTAAPLVRDLVTEFLPFFAEDLSFAPVAYACPRMSTRRWLHRHILPSPQRRAAFAALLGCPPAAYASDPAARTRPWPHVARALLAAAGLRVHLRPRRVVLDAHSFYLACLAGVPWLGLSESFFRAALRGLGNRADLLAALRVHAAACCLGGLVGPWHDAFDRAALNRMLLLRAEHGQLALANCSALRRYLDGPRPAAVAAVIAQLVPFARNRRWPQRGTPATGPISLSRVLGARHLLPVRDAPEAAARARFIRRARTFGRGGLRVYGRAGSSRYIYTRSLSMWVRLPGTLPTIDTLRRLLDDPNPEPVDAVPSTPPPLPPTLAASPLLPPLPPLPPLLTPCPSTDLFLDAHCPVPDAPFAAVPFALSPLPSDAPMPA